MAEVTTTTRGHVATVTLSNPARYNAMSLAMWLQLFETLEQLRSKPDVRVLILRGEGDRAFVSGADISEFASNRSSAAGVADYDRAVAQAQTALIQFPRPVIAAISGICYGGGLGLALACDLRYCAADAKFRMPAARLGLGYAQTGIERMAQVLGVARASELFFTATVCDGAEAARIGLVHSTHDAVFEHADATAAQIAENAPLSIAAAKLAFNALANGRAMLSRDSDGAANVAKAVEACFASSDYAEGRLAFAEKRPPRFTGR
ncbi:MAG: enoyl-CoA hydratase [Variovorax sp.]